MHVTHSYDKFRLFICNEEGVPTGEVVDLGQYMLESYGNITLGELHNVLAGRKLARQRVLFKAFEISRVGQRAEFTQAETQEVYRRVRVENPELFPSGGSPRNLRRLGFTDSTTVREMLTDERFERDLMCGAGGKGGYAWVLPENLWAVYRDEKLKLLDPYDRWR